MIITNFCAFFKGYNSANAATTILSTDFNGRTVSGATASGLNWTTNGVSDPGDLTADFNLFNTPATQDLFAVQRNIHTQGDWTVDITVAVGSQAIELDAITLDAYIFNNAGNTQSSSRDFDLTIDLLDSTKTSVLATDSVLDQFPIYDGPPPPPGLVPNVPNPAPLAFVFDFTGNILQGNTTYFLSLTASGQGLGNNAGIDNLVVTGTPVPEPLTMLGAGAALGFGAAFKRKLAQKKANKA